MCGFNLRDCPGSPILYIIASLKSELVGASPLKTETLLFQLIGYARPETSKNLSGT